MVHNVVNRGFRKRLGFFWPFNIKERKRGLFGVSASFIFTEFLSPSGKFIFLHFSKSSLVLSAEISSSSIVLSRALLSIISRPFFLNASNGRGVTFFNARSTGSAVRFAVFEYYRLSVDNEFGRWRVVIHQLSLRNFGATCI